jgi:hypothetical protein
VLLEDGLRVHLQHIRLRVFDGSAASQRALAAALAISRRDGGRLRVLLPPGDDAGRDRLRRGVEDLLGGTGVAPEFQALRDSTAECVARSLADADDALLVVAREPGEGGPSTRRLLSLSDRPIVIVR